MRNLKTNWLIRHSITVFSCVLIIVLGIAALTSAVPVTTSIGENISTNSLTATGLTVDTNTLYVDGTNNRVGIGTITPATALDVNGTTTSPTILGGTATTQDLSLQTTSGVGATGADMHFLVGNNGGTEAMTILNNGNVGVGVAAPGAKLHINGGVGSLATGLAFGDGDVGIYEIQDDDLVIANNNGRVLQTHNFDGRGIWSSAWNTDTWLLKSEQVSDEPTYSFYADYDTGVGRGDADELILYAGGEVIRLTGGNVGIGTTDPKTTLDINGTMKITKQSSTPYACAADYDGAIALTSTYRTCVCNGTSWVYTSDGTTDCIWE